MHDFNLILTNLLKNDNKTYHFASFCCMRKLKNDKMTAIKTETETNFRFLSKNSRPSNIKLTKLNLSLHSL